MGDDGEGSYTGRSDRSGESGGLSAQDRGYEASRQRQKIEEGLFAVLYTISKERGERSNAVSVLARFVDFAQILTLIVSPDYKWNLNFNSWLFRGIRFIQIQNPFQERGYEVYVAFVYTLEFMLAACLATCFYVAFSFNRSSFRWIWPIKVLKLFNAFVKMLTCVSPPGTTLSSGSSTTLNADTNLIVQAFPEHKCFELPHIVHLVTSLVCLIVFTAVALVLIVGEVEQSPLTTNILAQRNVLVEVRSFCLKTLLSILSATMASHDKTLGVVVLFTCTFVCYYQITWLPYHSFWLNVVEASLSSALAWSSLMLCLLNLNGGSSASQLGARSTITTLLVSGFFPAMLAGGLLSMGNLFHHRRVWRKFYTGDDAAAAGARRRKFKLHELQDIHAFRSPNHVELAANHWKYYHDVRRELAPEVTEAVDSIYKIGMRAFPASAALRLSKSTFLIEGKKFMMMGLRENAAALKLRPTFAQRFCIFTRDQQQRQAVHQASTGEVVSDMVSYVEFKRNYDLVLRTHRKALRTERSFWRCLLRRRIDIDELTSTFEQIEAHRLKARDMYKAMLHQHSSSVQLMRAYAHFLDTVMHDGGKAVYYLETADELEHSQVEARQRSLATAQGGGLEGGSAANERNQAAIYVTVNGVIKAINLKMEKLLGISHGDLVGQNIRELVPMPYAVYHQDWISRHAESFGDVGRLDLRTVPALHRKGHVVFGTLTVFDSVGALDEEDTFVATFDPVMEEESSAGVKAFVVLDAHGTVQAACLGLKRALIAEPERAVGEPLWQYASDEVEMRRSLDAAMADAKCGSNSAALMLNFQMQHPVGQMTVMSAKVRHRCFGDKNDFYELTMAEVKITTPLIVVNASGHITYAGEPAAELLRYKVKELLRRPVTLLMPSGLAARHKRSWLSTAASQPGFTPPCLAGHVAELRGKGGVKVYCKLNAQVNANSADRKYVLDLIPSSPEEQQRQCCATVDVAPDTLVVTGDATNCFDIRLNDGKDLRATCDLMATAHTIEQGQELVCAALEQRQPRKPAFVMMRSEGGDDEPRSHLAAISRASRMHRAALMTARVAASGGVVVDFWALGKLRGFFSVENYTIVSADRHAALLLGVCDPAVLLGSDLRSLAAGPLPRLVRYERYDEPSNAPASVFNVTVRTMTLPLHVELTPLGRGRKGLILEVRATRSPMLDAVAPDALLRSMAPHLEPDGIRRLIGVGFACFEGLDEARIGWAQYGEVATTDGGHTSHPPAPRSPTSSSTGSEEPVLDATAQADNVNSQDVPSADVKPRDGDEVDLSREGALGPQHVSKSSSAGSFDLATATAAPSPDLQTTVGFCNPLYDADAHRPRSSHDDLSRAVSLAGTVVDMWLSTATDDQGGARLQDPSGSKAPERVHSGRSRDSQPHDAPSLAPAATAPRFSGAGTEDGIDPSILSDAETLQSQKPGGPGQRTLQISALLAKAKVYQAGRKLSWTVAAASIVTLAVLLSGFCGLVVLTSVTRGDVRAILRFERALVSEARMMTEMRFIVWGAHFARLQVEEEAVAEYEATYNVTAPPNLPVDQQLLEQRLKNDSYLQAHAALLLAQVATFRQNHALVYKVSQDRVLKNQVAQQFFAAAISPVPPTLAAALDEGVVPISVLRVEYGNMSTWTALQTTQWSIWQAGNQLADLLANLAVGYTSMELAYPLGIQQSIEMQIILHTGPDLLPSAYVDLMLQYIGDTRHNASTVFKLSMGIMAFEIGCCLVACLAVCVRLKTLLDRRLALFSVFLRVPKAVLRAAAARKVEVEAIGGADGPAAVHEVVESVQSDDSSDSDADEADGGGSARDGSNAWIGSSAHGSVDAASVAPAAAPAQGVGEGVTDDRDESCILIAAPNADISTAFSTALSVDAAKSSLLRSRVQFLEHAPRSAPLVRGDEATDNAQPASLLVVAQPSEQYSNLSSLPPLETGSAHNPVLQPGLLGAGAGESSFRTASGRSSIGTFKQLPAPRRALRQKRWAVLRGGWVFVAILLVLVVITSTVSFNISTIGAKMYSLGMLSYLALTVDQVRFTVIAMTHVQSYTRRYKLRSILLDKLQRMRTLTGVIYSGQGIDSTLPQDLRTVYFNSGLGADYRSLPSSASAQKEVALLARGPPGGCWRVVKAQCLAPSDPLYEDSVLPPVDMIDRLWLEALQLVTDADAQMLKHAQEIGLQPPDVVNGTVPASFLSALDSESQRARDIELAQYSLDAEASDSYRFVDELVSLDLSSALSYVVSVRLDEVLNVCVTSTAAHCCGMAVTLALVLFYLRRTSRGVTGPASTRTVTFRVAEVLALMPKHVRVMSIIDAVLSRDGMAPKRTRTRANRIQPSPHGRLGDDCAARSRPSIEQASSLID